MFKPGYYLVQNYATGFVYGSYSFEWQANAKCDELLSYGLAVRVVLS